MILVDWVMMCSLLVRFIKVISTSLLLILGNKFSQTRLEGIPGNKAGQFAVVLEVNT